MFVCFACSLIFEALSKFNVLHHRKASLALMRKMVQYIPRPLLEEICNPDYMSVNFGALLVEVVATVLDHEAGVSQPVPYITSIALPYFELSKFALLKIYFLNRHLYLCRSYIGVCMNI